MKASYVITSFGERISRVNMIASVTEKFLSEDGNYSSITVDDGTGAIRVKVFKENVNLLNGTDVGQIVVVIGKVKEYNEEIYINGELVKAVEDKNHEALRKLEILDQLIERKKIVDEIRGLAEELSKEELVKYASRYEIDEEALSVILESRKVEIDYKPKILELIGKLDDGSGVDVGKLFELSQLPDNVLENAITELLNSGDLFEPFPNKLKRV